MLNSKYDVVHSAAGNSQHQRKKKLYHKKFETKPQGVQNKLKFTLQCNLNGMAYFQLCKAKIAISYFTKMPHIRPYTICYALHMIGRHFVQFCIFNFQVSKMSETDFQIIFVGRCCIISRNLGRAIFEAFI